MDKCGCLNSKAAAPALLRWALGLVFLAGGIAKVLTLKGFVTGYLAPAFEKTFIPGWLVVPYGYALPFVEVAIGVMLILGICREFSLFVTGLTLLSLAFGQIVLKDYGVVANIFLYLLMTAAAMWMRDEDCWALGASKCGKAEQGRPTG